MKKNILCKNRFNESDGFELVSYNTAENHFKELLNLFVLGEFILQPTYEIESWNEKSCSF